MEEFVEKVINIHKYVGIATLCIVAPAAMLTFSRSGFHRRAGQIYFYLMIFLYLSGSLRTFTTTLHGTFILEKTPPFQFWRNVTFNFFGFSLMFYGYRAIWLMYSGRHKKPQNLDWGLTVLLVLSSLGMIFTSFYDFLKLFPLAVIGGTGLFMSAVEVHEFRTCFARKDVLFARHQRYMLGSFFYAVTVFGVVEEIMDGRIKWLWPMGIGIVVIFLTTRLARNLIGRRHPSVVKWALRFSMIIPIVIFIISEIRN